MALGDAHGWRTLIFINVAIDINIRPAGNVPWNQRLEYFLIFFFGLFRFQLNILFQSTSKNCSITFWNSMWNRNWEQKPFKDLWLNILPLKKRPWEIENFHKVKSGNDFFFTIIIINKHSMSIWAISFSLFKLRFPVPHNIESEFEIRLGIN